MKKYKKKEYLQFMKLLNEACYNIKQFHFVRMIFEKSFSNLLYFEILPEDNEGDSFLGLIVYLEKNTNCIYPSSGCVYDYSIFKYRCFTKFKLTGNF